MYLWIGKKLIAGAFAALTIALISAAALMGTRTAAQAAPPCDAPLQALRQSVASTKRMDRAQAKAAFACLAAQTGPAKRVTSSTSTRTAAETPTVVATFGVNFWFTATCLQYYSDGTVTAGTTAFDWSQWKYPAFTQSASGTYFGMPAVLSVAELKDASTAAGYAVTVGNSAFYLTPTGAFHSLTSVASCGALLGAS